MNEMTNKQNSIENINEQLDDKKTVAVLLALLEGLSYEVLSSDVWFLATLQAKEIAIEKYGINEEVFNQVMTRFESARKTKSSANPMKSML